jgi:N-acetylglucosamine malate deacetylase 1
MRLSFRSLLQTTRGRRMSRTLDKLLAAASELDLGSRRCEPEKSKVVVLAPHMDDEVLGCGGTIARHVAAGSDVTVIFLTDGRRGGVVVAGDDDSKPDIVAVRKSEARQVARILGIRNLIFLDAEDSRLRSDPLVADRLREALYSERPDIVYLPFFLERHPDHRSANDVLQAATRGTKVQFECRGYEVWSPLFANCLVAIDATIELKRQALSCYRSQLAQMDYMHAGIGLNAWRAMGLGVGSKFAEAFFAAPLAEYLRLYGSLLGVSNTSSMNVARSRA